MKQDSMFCHFPLYDMGTIEERYPDLQDWNKTAWLGPTLEISA